MVAYRYSFDSVGPDGNAMHEVEQLMYVCHFLKGGGDILRLSWIFVSRPFGFPFCRVDGARVADWQVPNSNIVPVTVLPSSTLTKWSGPFQDVSVVICD